MKNWYVSPENKITKLNLAISKEEEIPVFYNFVKMSLDCRSQVWKAMMIISALLYCLTYSNRMFSFDVFEDTTGFWNTLKQFLINSAFVFGVYSENDKFFQSNILYFLLIVIHSLELAFGQALESANEEEAKKEASNDETKIIEDSESKNKNAVSETGSKIRRLITLKKKTSEDEDEGENENKADGRKKVHSILKRSPRKRPESSYTYGGAVSDVNSVGNATTISFKNQRLEEKTRLIEYYNNSYIYLKIKFNNGFLNILARLVIFILLINGNNKSTIFSVYLVFTGILVWREPKFTIKALVKISDFTLSLLVIQYALLVLNLNSLTSPVTIPSAVSSSSLLEYITGNTELIITPYMRLLGFGKGLIEIYFLMS